MLRSGNDAAHALAEHAGGSVEGFVDLMNEKAFTMGLNDTVFTNPSGFHDELHLSTAYETALMMYYAMGNEKFKKLLRHVIIFIKSMKKRYSWRNKHRLIHSEPYSNCW